MATLDNSNVVNGQTVEATDITQLYTALGTGSPGTITGLVMTGSLLGDVSGTSTNANFPKIINNTNVSTQFSVVFATAPISNGYAPLYVDSGSVGSGGAGSGMFYQPSTDTLTVTASYANEVVTSSYSSVANSVDGYISFNGQAAPATSIFHPIGGTVTLGGGGTYSLDILVTFPTLLTPTQGLGRDIIMTATDTTSPSAVQLAFSIGPPSIDFTGAAGDVISYSGWILS